MPVVAEQTCGQRGCQSRATATMLWPGTSGRRLLCDAHRAKALSIAGALGFVLPIEEIPQPAEPGRRLIDLKE